MDRPGVVQCDLPAPDGRSDGNEEVGAMSLHAATILLGSFLLFQVQPIIAKAILPSFGGAPAVWTTCLVFFQSLLLAGYDEIRRRDEEQRADMDGIMRMVGKQGG